MKRRDTRMSFDESRDALKRFESTVATPTQVFEEADDDSQDDEGQWVSMNVCGKQMLSTEYIRHLW